MSIVTARDLPETVTPIKDIPEALAKLAGYPSAEAWRAQRKLERDFHDRVFALAIQFRNEKEGK